MRTILVDWLVEVQENFELFHETLYLAVKILDRYLTFSEVKKEYLQLVGATAMLIAAKFEVSKSIDIAMVYYKYFWYIQTISKRNPITYRTPYSIQFYLPCVDRPLCTS